MLPLVSLVLVAFGATLIARELPNARNVLVLYSFSDRDLFRPLDSLKAAVRSRGAVPVHFYREYMDSQRFEDPGYEKSLSTTPYNAHSKQQLDVIVAAKLAEAAGRILSGEKPENVPVWHVTSSHVQVDWPQLKRWRLSESALPLDSIVLNRQPSVWGEHNELIVGGVALILLQGMWLAVLLRQRTKKRRSESDLHESENRFRIMADTAPALIWMSDPAGRITYLNKRGLEYIGAGPEVLMGDAWTSHIHPADLPGILALNARAYEQREGWSKEYRLRRHDGVYRWMFDVGAPRLNPDLSLAGFIGSAVDISDQKAAQEALEKLGSRLIEAQEAERQHIARELHDDICQRLTVLALEIEQSMKDSDGARPPMAQMRRVLEHCFEITGDVQALSHELHSSMLDHLGIVAAIQCFCDEYSEQQGVVIKFIHADVSHIPSRKISLCLFRVVQEAVHNAVKHSGVSLFNVRLQGTPDAIELEVCDAGVGLELDKVKNNGGLGLISMEERVHLVKGRFAIDSRVNGGTKIRVTVPLDANGTVTNSATEKDAEGEGWAA